MKVLVVRVFEGVARVGIFWGSGRRGGWLGGIVEIEIVRCLEKSVEVSFFFFFYGEKKYFFGNRIFLLVLSKGEEF